MEGVSAVFLQPLIGTEVVILLAPEHAGDGLAHHSGRVFTHGRWRDQLVELIGFTKRLREDFIKLLSERFAFLVIAIPPILFFYVFVFLSLVDARVKSTVRTTCKTTAGHNRLPTHSPRIPR